MAARAIRPKPRLSHSAPPMSHPPSPARAAWIDPSLLRPNAAASTAATGNLTPVRSRQQHAQQQTQQTHPKPEPEMAHSIAALSHPPRSAAAAPPSPAPSPPRGPREEKAQKRPDLGGHAQRVPVGRAGGATAAHSAAAASTSPVRAVTPTRLHNVSSPARAPASPVRVDASESAAALARKKQEAADEALARKMRDEEGGVEAIEDDDDAANSPSASEKSKRPRRKRGNSDDDEGSTYDPDEPSPSAAARKALGRSAAPPGVSASKRARVDVATVSGPKPSARTRKLPPLVREVADMTDDDGDIVEVDPTARAAPASKAAAAPVLTRAHAVAERGAAPPAAAAAGSSIASLPVSAPLAVAAVNNQKLLLGAYNRIGGTSAGVSEREKAAEEAARAARKKRGELSLPEMAKLYHLDVPACAPPISQFLHQ